MVAREGRVSQRVCKVHHVPFMLLLALCLKVLKNTKRTDSVLSHLRYTGQITSLQRKQDEVESVLHYSHYPICYFPNRHQ